LIAGPYSSSIGHSYWAV